MHRTDLRRRWQAMHYAVHLKKDETAAVLEIMHGDLGPQKQRKA